MASGTTVKIVDLQVNVSKAIQGIAQYNQQVELLRADQKMLRDQLKNGTITQQQYSQQMAVSTTAMRANQNAANQLNRQVQMQIQYNNQQTGSINQLKMQLQQATQMYNNLSAAERNGVKGDQLKTKIQSLNTEIKSASASASTLYKRLGNTSGITSGIGSMTSKLKGFASQMAMMATGGGLAAFAKSSVEIGRNFNDGMARVLSVTQASQEEMTKLTDKARELGRTTKFHATDAAQAMENLSRGGFNANETLTAIGTTLKMAQANAIDLNTSSDILIRTMRGFNLPITEDQMQRASDVLSQTARKSATNITELGEAFKNAAPFAGALNIPIEQVSAALGVLADRGVRASDAGTAMRMVLLGLASPTSKAGKVFKEYGININQAELASKGLAGVLETLNNSGILQDKQSMNKLSTIFGRRAVSNVISLIGNLDAYKGKLQEIEQSAGTTAQMFDQSYSKASIALFTLSSAFEDLKIEMFNQGALGIGNFADSITQVLYFMTANLPTITRLVKEFFAAFIFTKIAAAARASYTQMIATTIQAATTSTQAVTESETRKKQMLQETHQIRVELNKLGLANDRESNAKRQLLEQKLTLKKIEYLNEVANYNKLKGAEIVANENAVAIQTGTAWQKGLARAKLAFAGFVTSAKALMASFLPMLAFSLAFEGITRLVSYFKNLTTEEERVAKAHQAVVRQMDAQDQQITNAGIERAAKEKSRLDLLRAAAANANRPLHERYAAIQQLEKIVPSYHANISKSGQLFEQNTKAITDYVGTLKQAAQAEAAYSLYVKNAQQMMKNEQTIDDARTKRSTVQDRIIRDYGTVTSKTVRNTNSVNPNSTQTFYYATKNGKTVLLQGEDLTRYLKLMGYENKFNERITINENSNRVLEGQNRKYEDKFKVSTQAVKQGQATDVVSHDKSSVSGGDTTVDEKEQKKREKAAKAAQREREKQEREQKKMQDAEVKALDEAEKAELALLYDTAYKRRMAVEQQYDSEIRKLKERLATEKNLTATARDAINRTIIAKEQKKQQELDKLSDEEVKNTIAREQKLNEARLQVIRKGSADELKLRKYNIELQRIQSQRDLENEADVAAQNSSQNISAARGEVQIANGTVDTLKKQGKGAGDADYDAAVQAAEDANQRLADALAEQVATKQYYDDMAAAVDAKARQDSLKAEQEYQQSLNDLRIKGMENQLAQLRLHYTEQQQATHDAYEKLIAENERRREDESQQDYEARMADLANDTEYQQQKSELKQQMYDADNAAAEQQQKQQQDLQTLGLDVTTQQQMDELQMQRDIDQQRYDDIVAQGQLEGETEEEYNARATEAKEATEKDDEAINAASVKNEQAKLQSFRAVGDGLVSVLNAVGDENSAAAKIAKVITLAQIAIDTGKALAAGIASASSLPYPANLAAIATTVATILANVATAISTVKSAKFAEGGKVTGGGSSTSDSVNAQLSRGEYVMTAKATRLFEPLLATMNQIGAGVPIQANNSYREVQNTDAMTDGFTQAVLQIRPVVSVEEITDTQNRVETIQSLDNI